MKESLTVFKKRYIVKKANLLFKSYCVFMVVLEPLRRNSAVSRAENESPAELNPV